jgi:pyruvate ferredoxin oxidoreductase delta subunit
MEQGAVIRHNIKKSPITGYWRYARPSVDKNKCIGCGTCVKYCPEAAIELVESSKKEEESKEKMRKLPARYATPARNASQIEAGGQSVADVDYCFCKGCGVCARECPQKAIKMEKESASIKYQID